MNEEIMTNEAIEVVEGGVKSGKTLKTLGMVGAALLVGGLAYKFVAKPIIDKKKAGSEIESEVIDEETDVEDAE